MGLPRLPLLVTLNTILSVSITGGLRAAPPKARFQHEEAIGAVGFSPDGKLLATGGHDRTVRIWRIPGGEQVHVLQGHGGRVSSLAWFPDGKLLASAASDGGVILWDPVQGRKLRECKGHTDWVMSLACSSDGRLLATCSEDQTVRIWDPATGRETAKWTLQEESLPALTFSPDGKFLAVGCSPPRVRVFDCAARREAHTFSLYRRGEITGVAFTGQRMLVATAGSGRAWRCDMVQNHSEVVSVGRSSTLALVSSRDTRLLLLGGVDGELDLYDTALFTSLRAFSATVPEYAPGIRDLPKSDPGKITAVAISTDGRFVAAGCSDGRARLWRLLDLLHEGGPPDKMTQQDVERLWGELGAADSLAGYRALTLLAQFPAQAMAHFQDQIAPLEKVRREDILKWLGQLDDDDFDVREQATTNLERFSPVAEPELREAVAKRKVSIDAQKRIERILAALDRDKPTPERLREIRTVQVLEQIDTAEARQMLERLAKSRVKTLLAEEAGRAVERNRLLGR
jgi:hypothetical protein